MQHIGAGVQVFNRRQRRFDAPSILLAIGDYAVRPKHYSQRRWEQCQKHRAQGTPGKSDFAKCLGARSPDSPTQQFENPSAGEANICHDPVYDDGEYCKKR
jgi:hypothetical protein